MEFLCHDRYLRKVCPVPAIKSHVPPQYGRRNLRVGATMILSNLLTRRGECAVQSQRAMRWGSGNGVRHGMLGDVAHGLNAGQRAVMTHTWKHKQQHRRTCHCWLTRTFNAYTTGAAYPGQTGCRESTELLLEKQTCLAQPIIQAMIETARQDVRHHIIQEVPL